MNYEVAIVIPTLNEERFISRCLYSIIKQTFEFKKMDVMIIDGGSNDKTKDIVAEFQKSHQNIRFIENKKKNSISSIQYRNQKFYCTIHNKIRCSC